MAADGKNSIARPANSEAAPNLVQPELPNHYAYIYKFRVEQCPLFLQHKCTQHRPFTCFHWHFQNQRRRKPVRKRDGTLNYSADEYCTKYDETTGLCADGDECPFLHRTAGDTERRYHLRYYKTAPCVHETDGRGFCVKNGVHCAFAHGNSDLRNPVYDIRDLRAKEGAEHDPLAPNTLDKERNLLNDDPKWQDTNYVLINYKTEPCKKPPRLCRQGYACPQYHNSRDRRRSPKKFKYRSTPCPNAKHGEEWGDPTGCESGDPCQYCHTRTEQQFHPEIYKSTKCHDMQTNSYCPRGSFCAFAHGDFEVARDGAHQYQQQESGTNLSDILSNALPTARNNYTKDDYNYNGDNPSESPNISNGILESKTISASTSVPIRTAYNRLQSLENSESILASSGPSSAVGTLGFGPIVQPIGKPRSFSVPGSEFTSSMGLDRLVNLSLKDDWGEQPDSSDRKSSLYSSGTLGNLLPNLQPASYFHRSNNTAELDELNREYEAEQPSLCESIAMGVASSGLLPGSAPVNIPRSDRPHPPPRLTPSPPNLNNVLPRRDDGNSLYNRVGSYGNSGLHFHDWNQQSPVSNGLRGFQNSAIAHSPLMSNGIHNSEVQDAANKVVLLEEDLSQARKACDAWRCKALLAEQQRDEALSRMLTLQNEMKMLRESVNGKHRSQLEELRNMPL